MKNFVVILLLAPALLFGQKDVNQAKKMIESVEKVEAGIRMACENRLVNDNGLLQQLCENKGIAPKNDLLRAAYSFCQGWQEKVLGEKPKSCGFLVPLNNSPKQWPQAVKRPQTTRITF